MLVQLEGLLYCDQIACKTVNAPIQYLVLLCISKEELGPCLLKRVASCCKLGKALPGP